MRLRWAGYAVAFAVILGAGKRAGAQLKRDCDVLVAKAVVRAYGIAWSPDNSRAPLVSYAPGQAAAVGWVLWEAGKITHESRYTRAAIDVARGMANGQEAGGKIPDTVRFGMNDDRGQDTPQFIPSRASTCAALGLLLTILHDSPQPDPRLRSCALLAARWLSRQQTEHGAWVVQDTTQAQESRVIRLDSPDWRNSTLAMLLASDVLKNQLYSNQAHNAAQMLLDLHLPQSQLVGAGGWTGAYGLDKTPRGDIPDAPLCLDTLATRYCMQTLLASAVCQGNIGALERVHLTCKTLRGIRDADGTFYRYVQLSGRPSEPMGLASPQDALLPGVMHTVEELDAVGLSAYSRSMDAHRGIDYDLARVLSGAGDDLFSSSAANLETMAASLRQAIVP